MIRITWIALAALMGAGAPAAPPIPPGTDIPVTVDEKIPIDRERLGESFDAHVTRDVMVNGEVAIPAGSPAKVTLEESGEKSDAATLRLTQVRVNGEQHRVQSDVAKADSRKSGLSTEKRTGVGAAAGAVIGAITGVGVLKGAIVGAGGGLAWGLLDKDREIPDDTPLRFSLQKRLEL